MTEVGVRRKKSPCAGPRRKLNTALIGLSVKWTARTEADCPAGRFFEEGGEVKGGEGWRVRQPLLKKLHTSRSLDFSSRCYISLAKATFGVLFLGKARNKSCFFICSINSGYLKRRRQGIFRAFQDSTFTNDAWPSTCVEVCGVRARLTIMICGSIHYFQRCGLIAECVAEHIRSSDGSTLPSQR